MNAQRRKEIEAAIELIRQGQSQLEDLMNEEQDYYDNMPEGLQSSERGEMAEAAISALESAISGCEDAINNAEEALG